MLPKTKQNKWGYQCHQKQTNRENSIATNKQTGIIVLQQTRKMGITVCNKQTNGDNCAATRKRGDEHQPTQHNEWFIKLLQQCPFSFLDVTVIYKQCYLPTVSYPLAATAIPLSKLLKTQSPTTSIFLQKMGFPQTFPHAVAYAASDRRGIGLHNLGYEQGVQKCLQMLKHLWTNTEIGRIYHITLQHFQLASGLSQPVLQDTQLLPWSHTPWIDNLQAFLHNIHGQIAILSPGCAQPHCYQDQFIMDDVLSYKVPPKQALQIQRDYIFKSPSYPKSQTTEARTLLQQWSTKLHEPNTPSIIDKTRAHSSGPDNLHQDLPLGSSGVTLSPGHISSWIWCDSRNPSAHGYPHMTRIVWRWQVFPKSYYLFHYMKGQWWAFALVRWYPTHIGYSRHPSPTSMPTGMVPATPILFPYKIHILVLPVTPIAHAEPLPYTHTPWLLHC